MPVDDIEILRGDRGQASLPADDVGSLFAAVVTARDPVGEPIVAFSWGQVRGLVGDHTPYSTLRSVEQYFRAGGTRAVLSRLVGPARTTATLALRDGTNPVLTLTAVGPGASYHDVRVTTVRGTGDVRTITLTDDDVEVFSGDFEDALEAKAALDATGLVTAAIGAGVWANLTVISDTALAGGDDDRANIRDATVATATSAEVLPKEYGAGSLTAPGFTSFDVAEALATNAAATNRIAPFDCPDTPTAGTITALLRQLRGLGRLAGYLMPLVSWPVIEVGGIETSVPPSGVIAGRMALADQENGPGPGQPAARSFGALGSSIVGVSQTYSVAELDAIRDLGGNVLLEEDSEIALRNANTAADPNLWPQYSEVAGMRVTMAIESEFRSALRPLRQRNLDSDVIPQATSLGAEICERWYARRALYGATSAEAYAVAVDAPVTGPNRRKLIGSVALRNTTSIDRIEFTIEQVATGDTI